MSLVAVSDLTKTYVVGQTESTASAALGSAGLAPRVRQVATNDPGQAGLVLWERQFLPFARSYRVIRYDARGFGRSKRPDEVFSHYEDLRGLLDHLGIERASLVGLSLGGRTAIDFVLTHPSRVTSLVLVNVGISGYKFTRLAEYFKAIKDAADRGDRETFVEVSLRQWFDGPGQPATRTAPALREEVKRLMREHTEQARGAIRGRASKRSGRSSVWARSPRRRSSSSRRSMLRTRMRSPPCSSEASAGRAGWWSRTPRIWSTSSDLTSSLELCSTS